MTQSRWDKADRSRQREDRVRQIVNACVERRAKGEQISDNSLIDAHPDLMPELGTELHNLHMIEQAERLAGHASTEQSPGLHIRCPHCRNAIEIVEEASLTDVLCPSCGSSFSLVEDPHSFPVAQMESVGHFKLLDKLGAGAFGSVWSAKDTELDRMVAIKIPRKGQLSAEDAEQFIREARAAAQLSHPHIIPVHEVGREGDRVYIVSQFVHGVNMADWLSQEQTTPHEAARLCAKLADALHHAHQHGVIHRDLKPSNIMLDRDGEPHLMDFGLAKRDAGEITMTVEGKLIGTPAYMSPEQARGKAHEADSRSDVYSMGVILFELLTGERPFRGSSQMLIHQILVEDAPSPRRFNWKIPRDLETICLKCLEKEPNRRYQTAEEVANDLQRFLRGEPVQARPITQIGRIRRWSSRNPVVAGLGVTLAILLLVLAVVGPIVAVHQKRLAARANNEAKRADREAEDRRRLLYSSDMNLAMQRWEEADVSRVHKLLERHVPQRDQEDLRGFEWYYLQRLCRRSKMTPSFWSGGGLRSIAFSPDGQSLASAQAFIIKRWNHIHSPGDRTPAFLLIANPLCVAYSPDGKTLAAGNDGGMITMWNTVTDEYRFLLGHSGPVVSVAFSSDGKCLVSAGSEDKSVRRWDVLSGKREFVPCENVSRVLSLALSPDDRTVATGDFDGVVRLWDTHTGNELNKLEGHTSAITSLAISPDGSTLASASWDETIRLWRTDSGKLARTLPGHSGSVSSVDISPDGMMLASGSCDKTVRLWDLLSGDEVDTLKGHASTISSVAFSPDGKYLASAGSDETVRLWDVTIQEDRHLLPGNFDGEKFSFAVSPDGRTIVTPSLEGIALRDANTGEVKNTLDSGPLSALAFSSDGTLLATASYRDKDHHIKLWDMESGQLSPLVSHTGRVLSLAFSPNDDWLASGSDDASVRIWNVRSAETRHCLRWHSEKVWTVAWSPDGSLLASGSADSTVVLWNASRGRQERTLFGHKGREQVMCVAFSPAGGLLASASTDHTVKVWKVPSGTCRQTLAGHSGPVNAVAFSRDGTTLASGGPDGTVRLWNTTNGSERFTFRGNGEDIHCLAFLSGDGVLAAGSQFGDVRLWRAPTAQNVDPTSLRHEDIYARAYHHAEHGRWRNAAVDFERTLVDLRPGTHAWSTAADRLAALFLHMGDIDRYQTLCSKAVDCYRDTKFVDSAERVSTMCLISRHNQATSVHLEATRLADSAANRLEQAIADRRFSILFSRTLIPRAKGIAHYRHGDYTSAIKWFNTSLATIPDSARSRWHGHTRAGILLFLAMSHQQLSQDGKARRYFEEAIGLYDGFQKESDDFYAMHWSSWIECQLIRREAEGLIRSQSGKVD